MAVREGLPPETAYVRVDGHHVAYQIFGSGPPLLLCTPTGHMDGQWAFDELATTFERLASFATVVNFDPRGLGMSDPAPLDEILSDEAYAADVEAVLGAAGVASAAVYASGERAPSTLALVAAHPGRVDRLVIDNGTARLRRDEGYPIGMPDDVAAAFLDYVETSWGDPARTRVVFPVDEARRQVMAKRARLTMPPALARHVYGRFVDADVRHLLDGIDVPTLVMHRRDSAFVRPDHGRYLAERIRGAEHVEYHGDETDIAIAEEQFPHLERFVTGREARRPRRRALAAVLRTDIVGSTEMAAAVGDRRWTGFVEDHARITGATLERFDGRLVRNTGDGMIATFALPGDAVRCAQAIRAGVAGIGLEVRAGVHVGEIDLLSDDVAGIAVNICTRLCDLADPGGILVSATVRDLSAGSALSFADRGVHTLKGLPEPWRVYAVEA